MTDQNENQPQLQQQQLVTKHHRVKQKSIKRQLMLVSILNLSTFVSFVFAMCFYQWVWMELDFQKNVLDSKVHRYWVNLLYMKEDVPGAKYQGFAEVQRRICIANIYCSATFYQLHLIGYLCFSIFSIAILMQLFQFITMIYYILTLGKIVETKKNFKYFISIGTYAIGLTLTAFSVNLMDNIQFKFGVSYWLCSGVLSVFMVIIVYGKISLRKMVKQALIQNLLDMEKSARCEKMRVHSNIHDDGKSDEKLTL